ncbi:hypothetical protein FHS43_000069 [Streptosporangium becharense]|uniref:Uncharacterized protein n=1 Tax=Streptosporangium becharense TaxID=1816182 RepID=A0A7W9IG70_9ACTN|nr:hypothetical protein [Streptosporangium becharense]MBB5820159.1 hypothetical protein [Streptosporangium becharense]
MARKYLLRSSPKWGRYRWAMLFLGVVLTLAVGFHLAGRGDPGREGHPVVVPVKRGGASDTHMVEKVNPPI